MFSLLPLIVLAPYFKYPETEISELTILSDNTLKSNNIPFIPKTEVLGVKLASTSDIKELLACLIKYESGGNPNAYNPKDTDGRPKFGLLQFDRKTFEDWCVVKYNLFDNIWNGEIQKQCFYLMVSDNQSWQWPSYKKCLANTQEE